ncbi:hypothetical protein PVE_R2G0324 [Pseudomonas veronii 1YdBTEX2]|uniref:Uncharacterized protein n=1 Tax=Pseudomonas veronii 1YdBTEX2 TaxID=1295141 RepID=A0A1D3K7M7_PSEVE|nr:hypothetical protein PVE_R2G0324 [Pseudomonas veronii 1YdBTEX2]
MFEMCLNTPFPIGTDLCDCALTSSGLNTAPSEETP